MVSRQTLLITKYIRKILVDNISALQSRIYALDARVGTKFPFAAIERGTVTVTGVSKDGIYEEVVGVTVYILSKDYDSGVVIANDIRNLLDRSHYTDETIKITSINFTGCDEMYIDANGGAFMQRLTFDIKL